MPRQRMETLVEFLQGQGSQQGGLTEAEQAGAAVTRVPGAGGWAAAHAAATATRRSYACRRVCALAAVSGGSQVRCCDALALVAAHALVNGALRGAGGTSEALPEHAVTNQSTVRCSKARAVRREKRRERKRREKGEGAVDAKKQAAPDMTAGLTADEIAMMQTLGLPFGFQTTQGAEVDDAAANESAVKVTSQRQPRQYMNRKGGFNRMLPAEKNGQKMQQV